MTTTVAAAPAGAALLGPRCGVGAAPVAADLPVALPRSLHFLRTELAPTDRVGSPLVGTTTAGCAWWDRAAAASAAVGEAAEWYCGSLVPDGLPVASWSQLHADGHRALDPASLVLYSPQQLASPGFPFVPFTRELAVAWTRGTSRDGRTVLVPASLVHLGYGSGPTYGVPRVNLPVNAGIAAGPDRRSATTAALREVVERDALAVAWHAGSVLEPLRLPWRWAQAVAGPRRACEARLVRLPSRYHAPVLLAVLHDRDAALMGVGAAYRPDPVEGARKALAEAGMSLAVAHDLAGEHSGILARLQRPVGALHPWRADRRYRDSYRADLRDVIDVSCHVQHLLDPRSQDVVLARVPAAGAGARHLLDVPRGREADGLLAAAGLEPVLVDVTTSDVAAAGLHVVKAVVPGTRSTAPAALPFLADLRAPDGSPVTQPVLDPVPHA